MPIPALGDRALFPELAARVYLDHAAVSPLSTPVRAAIDAVVADFAAHGVGAIHVWMERREALRARVAALLGARSEDIGFPPGTTRGIVDIALAIPWRRGDRVVVFEGEFPSNVLPWKRVAERFELELCVLPLGHDAGRTALAEATREPVRLVAVSAVQFQTGLRMPLREVAALTHAAGGELFVDAIQALGAVPMHVEEGWDYLVAGTHKWLMGMDGLAIAYASPAARAKLRPLTGGWLSTEEPLRFLMEGAGHLRYDRPLKTALSWMEGGVQTTAPFAALDASLDLLASLGIDAIWAHCQAWHDRIEPELLARGFASGRAAHAGGRSGTLALRPPPGVSLADLAASLRASGISVSTPDGWLRMAPHWPNALVETEVVLDAIDAALAQLTKA